MELKQINELTDGACTVVTESGNRYNGKYNSRFEMVFKTIPLHEIVIGYLQ